MNEHNGNDAEDDDADYHNNAVENDGQDVCIVFVVMLLPFRLTAELLLLLKLVWLPELAPLPCLGRP